MATRHLKKSIGRSSLRLGLHLVPLVLACFALLPSVQATPDPGAVGGGNSNAADGFGALNAAVSGINNSGFGANALHNLTIGNNNAAQGNSALNSNTNGNKNTALGVLALRLNLSGDDNVAVGYRALNSNNGDLNVAVGSQALFSNKAATANVAVGFQALFSNTDVGGNTAVGFQALGQSSGGSENVALGATAGGALTTGGGNINIGSGVSSTAGASNEIRIGNDQTATFIAGIFGATAPSGAAVSVTAEGKLGTVTSSVRFKDEIKPMDKASEAILALKPVTFRYKKEIDPQRVPQFGLVAEDVEKVNPDLVVRDDKGDIYSVRYDQVNAMLLNEFLKQHRTVQEQQKEIDALKAELKEQRAFIQRVNDKMELDRPAPQTVLNNQ